MDGKIKNSTFLKGQWLLPLLFLLVAIYALQDATLNFSRFAARIFPQIAAVIVIVGAILILLQNHLPESLRRVVSEDTRLTLMDEPSDLGLADDDPSTDSATDRSPVENYDRPLSPQVFTTLIIFLYIATSYLVGIFWTTPLFAIGYLYWFRTSWRLIIVLTLLATVIPLAFMEISNINFYQGLLTG